jgi:hypothetical protein
MSILESNPGSRGGRWFSCAAALVWIASGCTSAEVVSTGGGDDDDDGSADADTDADGDSDSDGDGDGDGDSDSDGDVDTGTGDDPTCGAATQPCCNGSSCDDPETLVCVGEYPDPGDAFCWELCDPVDCTTLEGHTGPYCSSVDGTGVCIGLPDYPPAETDCDLYGCSSGSCYTYDQGSGCFATGCDYSAGCGYPYWCAPLVSGDGACIE